MNGSTCDQLLSPATRAFIRPVPGFSIVLPIYTDLESDGEVRLIAGFYSYLRLLGSLGLVLYSVVLKGLSKGLKDDSTRYVTRSGRRRRCLTTTAGERYARPGDERSTLAGLADASGKHNEGHATSLGYCHTC